MEPDAARHVPQRWRGRDQPAVRPAAYQQSLVPDAISNFFGTGKGRAVPDVAAVGDPSTGMLVGQAQTFPDGTDAYCEFRLGGTSLSSPLFAGIMALADQRAGRPHGFANPAVYAHAGTSAFHDVVAPGSPVTVVRNDFVNSVDAGDGIITSLRTMDRTGTLHTRPAYDDVTGVGSPNGAAFLAAMS